MASEFGKSPIVQHVVDVGAMVIIRVLYGDLGTNGGGIEIYTSTYLTIALYLVAASWKVSALE